MIFNEDELEEIVKSLYEFNNWEGWVVLESVLENMIKILRKRRDRLL